MVIHSILQSCHWPTSCPKTKWTNSLMVISNSSTSSSDKKSKLMRISRTPTLQKRSFHNSKLAMRDRMGFLFITNSSQECTQHIRTSLITGKFNIPNNSTRISTRRSMECSRCHRCIIREWCLVSKCLCTWWILLRTCSRWTSSSHKVYRNRRGLQRNGTKIR